jgi:hypothetical protein
MEYETVLNQIWWPMNKKQEIIDEYFAASMNLHFFFNLEDKLGAGFPLIDMEDYNECFKTN